MFNFGIVKWFGGYNNKTNRENNFGFITDQSGIDVFIHEKEWREEDQPYDNQVVYYILEEDRGKWKASSARSIEKNNVKFEQIYDAFLCVKSNAALRDGKIILLNALRKELNNRFLSMDKDEILSFLSSLESKKEFIDELIEGEKRDLCLDKLISYGNINPLSEVPLDKLPHGFYNKNEDDVLKYILSLDNVARHDVCNSIVDKLSVGTIIYLAIKDSFITEDDLYKRKDDIEKYIENILNGRESNQSDFVKDAIDTELKIKGGFGNIKFIKRIYDLVLFKKYLFDKNPKFSAIYESSEYLKTRADILIINEVFSLLLAGNNSEKTYKIFLNKLWEAIKKKLINPIDQRSQIIKIFPVCHTMPHGLSCEAVYWKKQDVFLCRGKRCLNPKVLPDLSKSYMEFNIYDWFSHYKIDYFNEREPSVRDFPIKIAGYFNRLYEVFPRIHCRACGSLMLPDMRYSRVEYKTIENGEVITKQMAASYRITVFKCPVDSCCEHNVGYYINHCVGFGCYDVIDTRDLRVRCDAGLYVCKSCGSCCEEHAKSNPVGKCPKCGSFLKLYEKNNTPSNQYKKNRYVKCSAENCDFHIEGDSLPKKFYLSSCTPVFKVNK